ncbi:hypothetical protein C8R44DRAFT_729816 [Mycena epipterygia]|nr:hypothetical protein C8R44DRAFT_729816 [Mycena epipterygia]
MSSRKSTLASLIYCISFWQRALSRVGDISHHCCFSRVGPAGPPGPPATTHQASCRLLRGQLAAAGSARCSCGLQDFLWLYSPSHPRSPYRIRSTQIQPWIPNPYSTAKSETFRDSSMPVNLKPAFKTARPPSSLINSRRFRTFSSPDLYRLRVYVTYPPFGDVRTGTANKESKASVLPFQFKSQMAIGWRRTRMVVLSTTFPMAATLVTASKTKCPRRPDPSSWLNSNGLVALLDIKEQNS